MSKQEVIIQELCVFYHLTLSQVFDKTCKHSEAISEAFSKHNLGKAMSAVTMNDPFKLYQAYSNFYKPIKILDKDKNAQRKMILLKA